MLFQMKEVQFWSFMFHLLNSSRKKVCYRENDTNFDRMPRL